MSPSPRKYQKKAGKVFGMLAVPDDLVEKKRRSQSPSRSRSVVGGKSPVPRRRQRTRSRSRPHAVGDLEETQAMKEAEVAIEDDED